MSERTTRRHKVGWTVFWSYELEEIYQALMARYRTADMTQRQRKTTTALLNTVEEALSKEQAKTRDRERMAKKQ